MAVRLVAKVKKRPQEIKRHVYLETTQCSHNMANTGNSWAMADTLN